jgi:hypothetical protein
MSIWTRSPPPTSASSQSTNANSTMSTSTASSVQITITEVPEGKLPPKVRPRRGGCTTEAWMCCVCKYHNKIGRSWCSNLNKDTCAGKLSQEDVNHRSESEKSLNHRRCEACYPSQYGVYVNGHLRRWPQLLDRMEHESMVEDADHELEREGKKDFDKMLAERKPKPAQRDPLRWQRTGEWPQ